MGRYRGDSMGIGYEGFLEIPIIKKPDTMIIPDGLVPFSKMEKANPKAAAVCKYENDFELFSLIHYALDAYGRDKEDSYIRSVVSDKNPFIFDGIGSADLIVYKEY